MMHLVSRIPQHQSHLFACSSDKPKNQGRRQVHAQHPSYHCDWHPIEPHKVNHAHVTDCPHVVLAGIPDLMVLLVHIFVQGLGVPQTMDAPEDNVADKEAKRKMDKDAQWGGGTRGLVKDGLPTAEEDEEEVEDGSEDVIADRVEHHGVSGGGFVGRADAFNDKAQEEVDYLDRGAAEDLEVAGGHIVYVGDHFCF